MILHSSRRLPPGKADFMGISSLVSPPIQTLGGNDRIEVWPEQHFGAADTKQAPGLWLGHSQRLARGRTLEE